MNTHTLTHAHKISFNQAPEGVRQRRLTSCKAAAFLAMAFADSLTVRDTIFDLAGETARKLKATGKEATKAIKGRRSTILEAAKRKGLDCGQPS